MEPMKASILDNDHLRLLAIPFTGPFPHPSNGRGADRVGDWFDERTNVYRDLLEARPVDWHHGESQVPYSPKPLGRTVIGKAILDPEPDEDGWWVDFWVKKGEERLNLIKRVAERQPIFGSSEALWRKADADGHITEWPYYRQTLSTSPENTHSILRPAIKASLDDFSTAGIAVDDRLRSFIEDLDALGVDLRSTSLGEDAAKAGRVLAGRNERRLREAIAALSEVMAELDKYAQETT
jgi:hypothetical protein